MSGLRVALLGADDDLALAGAEGRFAWGEIVAAPAGEALTIELVRGAPARSGALAWDGGRATLGAAGDPAPARRLPWPAGPRAFGLPEPPPGAPALLAGPAELTAPIADRLGERGIDCECRDRVTLAALGAAGVVHIAAAADAPPPPETMAVLAAGRVLVLGRHEPLFGLQPGIDCHIEATADGIAQRIEAAVAWPDAFDLTRAMARVAAACHRTDVVLHRLAVDAALGVS
jgi:hypothetical protein